MMVRNSTGEELHVSDTVVDRQRRRYYIAKLNRKTISAVSMDELRLHVTTNPEHFGCHRTN